MRRRIHVLVSAAALAVFPPACSRAPKGAGPSPIGSVEQQQAIDPAAKAAEDPPRKKRRLPTGAAPRMSCAAARTLIGDVETRLAAAPPAIAKNKEASFEKSLADATLDWADPHGLWTASPDTPVAPFVRARAAKLRAVLEGHADCATELRPIGEALGKWVSELRTEWTAATTAALGDVKVDVATAAGSAVIEAAFEDGPLTRTARALTRELASRSALTVKHQPSLAVEADLGRERWLPELSADAWGEVVLAAAVRAWVPLIDPHGAWAPTEESATLYDRDLEVAPPPRLWTSSTRTAIGVRIDAGAVAPLLERDVVLSIDGVTVAGLSAEAIDQLAEAPDDDTESRAVRVLRVRDAKWEVVKLDLRAALGDEHIAVDPLPVEIVPYASGHAFVVRLSDVPDGLGDDLARALATARAETPDVIGLILDLRGNGGGSIDGATSALGLFLPGAPLFPLRHRDGAIETERATEPPAEDRWLGPVAALVDSGTASAAEMIAGALHAYRRGLVIGTTTYGKGCAQEYVDDPTGVGVLRLTTLLFALPDGTAVQRLGLHPDVLLPLPMPLGVKDREADLPRAAPSWTGPDIRDPKRVVEVPWPPAKAVGPCKDAALCRTLRALSSSRNFAKR